MRGPKFPNRIEMQFCTGIDIRDVVNMDLASLNLMLLAPNTIELCEITQNDGYLAVQGHSRSSILVPIEARMRLSVSACHSMNNHTLAR